MERAGARIADALHRTDRRQGPTLKTLKHIALDTARAVIPKQTRARLLKALGPRRFSESMITRETRGQAIRRRLSGGRPVLRHLDVHVTDHCNLNCKGCEHYSPLCEPTYADIAEVRRELGRLAELFDTIEQIYLLGGEPLLHPQVEQFVYAARDAFPRTRLCLMTNGVLVTRMDPTVWRALAETNAVLLCDDYPIKLPKERMEELAREYGVTLEWMKPATEFFKAPIDPSGSCDAEKSFTACQWVSNCAIMRDGRLYACAHIAYADAPAREFGLPQIVPTDADSIDIFSAGDGDQVIDFLTSPAPWCRFCDYEHTETYSWGRTGRKAEEWISKDWIAAHDGQPDHQRPPAHPSGIDE